jgi:cytochrome c oxidase subunit 1
MKTICKNDQGRGVTCRRLPRRPSLAAFLLEFRPAMYSSDPGMLDHHSGANPRESPQPGFLRRAFFPTDHKTIGLRYLWLALLSVFLGMVMSLVMRIHLVWPAARLPLLSNLGASPQRYAALTLLHGSLMVLMVLTAAPQAGFGNYLLPIQIGARDMAFPRLNLAAFWATCVSLVGVTSAFFLAPQTGLTLWISGLALFCAATLANALNFSVTTIDRRAKGMTLPRLPVTAWAWFINAILSLLIFSILLAACVYLLSDRILGTQFFAPDRALGSLTSQTALPAVWQRLFWFFAQAQVYVAMLPCFGIVTHLLATFSRKPVWLHRGVVLALCAVGLVGFCIWGEHTFATGLNPYSPLVFSLLASSLGIPASLLLMSWFGTFWNGKTRLNTAMLFALGFVSLFLSGGLSGLFLSRNDLTASSPNDDFITGHFHLVMGIAATFAMLGALFFWFPKMFGRSLDERLGKIHFWLTFAGVYCVFMPMHWLGLIAHLPATTGGASTAAAFSGGAFSGVVFSSVAASGSVIRSFITAVTLLTVAAQSLFLTNLVASLLKRRAESAEKNPWRATTLEWSIPSPPPPGNFPTLAPVIYRGAYDFSPRIVGEDFALQDVPVDASPPPPPVSGMQHPGLEPLSSV